MTREEAIKAIAEDRLEAMRDCPLFEDCEYRLESCWECAANEPYTMAIEALKREDTMLKEIERVVLYGEGGEVNG